MECQNGFRKDRSCIDLLFGVKLLIEKNQEFNLETHLAFVDYVKASGKVKREKLFEILHSKNIPNLFLKSITKIYSGNKMKVKIISQSSEEHTIKHGVRQGCPLPPTLFNIYMNVRTVKWNQIYIKGVTLSTNTKVNTLLITNDQVLTAALENNLQTEVFTWQIVLKWKYYPNNLRWWHFQDKTQ